ncbi:hypothetical protein THRCLA_00557 [Thraustotheca clavata]|uniref:Uncharacterized protein n=1 Tax=Thraustotheca clavata TaxID=74557 RepID=A0A1W0AB63_9STRA|nr:hypothetical protein THRCLA_00557 [Thraustotheca clavata]
MQSDSSRGSSFHRIKTIVDIRNAKKSIADLLLSVEPTAAPVRQLSSLKLKQSVLNVMLTQMIKVMPRESSKKLVPQSIPEESKSPEPPTVEVVQAPVRIKEPKPTLSPEMNPLNFEEVEKPKEVEIVHPPQCLAVTTPKLIDAGEHVDEIRQAVIRLVAEGEVVTALDPQTHVAYDHQGDLKFYTDDNLQKRLELRYHPMLCRMTRVFWLTIVKPNTNIMVYDEYEKLYLRIHKVLIELFDLKESRLMIADDWKRDITTHDALEYEMFHLSLFELIDIWCDSLNAEDYINLLYLILNGITQHQSGSFRLRRLEEISYVDVSEAAEDVSSPLIAKFLDQVEKTQRKAHDYLRDEEDRKQLEASMEEKPIDEPAIVDPAGDVDGPLDQQNGSEEQEDLQTRLFGNRNSMEDDDEPAIGKGWHTKLTIVNQQGGLFPRGTLYQTSGTASIGYNTEKSNFHVKSTAKQNSEKQSPNLSATRKTSDTHRTNASTSSTRLSLSSHTRKTSNSLSPERKVTATTIIPQSQDIIVEEFSPNEQVLTTEDSSITEIAQPESNSRQDDVSSFGVDLSNSSNSETQRPTTSPTEPKNESFNENKSDGKWLNETQLGYESAELQIEIAGGLGKETVNKSGGNLAKEVKTTEARSPRHTKAERSSPFQRKKTEVDSSLRLDTLNILPPPKRAAFTRPVDSRPKENIVVTTTPSIPPEGNPFAIKGIGSLARGKSTNKSPRLAGNSHTDNPVDWSLLGIGGARIHPLSDKVNNIGGVSKGLSSPAQRIEGIVGAAHSIQPPRVQTAPNKPSLQSKEHSVDTDISILISSPPPITSRQQGKFITKGRHMVKEANELASTMVHDLANQSFRMKPMQAKYSSLAVLAPALVAQQVALTVNSLQDKNSPSQVKTGKNRPAPTTSELFQATITSSSRPQFPLIIASSPTTSPRMDDEHNKQHSDMLLKVTSLGGKAASPEPNLHRSEPLSVLKAAAEFPLKIVVKAISSPKKVAPHRPLLSPSHHPEINPGGKLGIFEILILTQGGNVAIASFPVIFALLCSMKQVDSTNVQLVRSDALRLVTEGVVLVEPEAPTSYDKQGNLAYYSEESLMQRLSHREHPLLRQLTKTFWSLTQKEFTSTMSFDGYYDIMIRVHKILNEHFDVESTLHMIEDDWNSDTQEEGSLSYEAFHLSMYELVDLWCDSVDVNDYVSLLFLILKGITRLENHHLFLKELEDVYFTDVEDDALRSSMADIENDLGDIKEIDIVSDKVQSKTQPSFSVQVQPPIKPKTIASPAQATIASISKGHIEDSIPVDVAIAELLQTQSTDRNKIEETNHKFKSAENVEAPVAKKILDSHEKTLKHKTHKQSPTKPTVQNTTKTSPRKLSERNDIRVSHEVVKTTTTTQPRRATIQTTQPKKGSNFSVIMLTLIGITEEAFVEDEIIYIDDSGGSSPRHRMSTVDTVPLISTTIIHFVLTHHVERDFGGFSIMSARDEVVQAKKVITLTNIRKEDELQAPKLTKNEQKRNSTRSDEIAKAFDELNRISLTRAVTPPTFTQSFGLHKPQRKAQSISEVDASVRDTDIYHGRQLVKKAQERQRSTVDLVDELVHDTIATKLLKSSRTSGLLHASSTTMLSSSSIATLSRQTSVAEAGNLEINLTSSLLGGRRSSVMSLDDKIKLNTLLASVHQQWQHLAPINTEDMPSVGLCGQKMDTVASHAQLKPVPKSPPRHSSPEKPLPSPPKTLPALELPPKKLLLEDLTPNSKSPQRLVSDPLVKKFKIPARVKPKLSHEPIHLTPLSARAPTDTESNKENDKEPTLKRRASHVQHEGSVKFILVPKAAMPSPEEFVHISSIPPASQL